MPIIPYIQQSNPLPKLPDATLDRNKRPTANNNGVIQAVGQLADASKLPTISGKAMAAPYEALSDVGAALARTGNIIGAAAERQAAMEDEVQVNRTKVRMKEAMLNFEATKPNDPLLWTDHWEKTIGPLKDELLSNEKLSPRARAAITTDYDAFSRLGLGNVQVDQRRAVNHEAAKGLAGNIGTAIVIRDEKGMEWQISSGLQDHLIAPWQADEWRRQYKDEGDRQEKQQRADAFKGAQNGVVNIAADRGEKEAIEMIDKLGNFSPVEKEALRNAAQAAHHDRAGEEMSGLLEGIDIGAITNDADVEVFAHGKAHLNPHAIESAKDYLKKRDSAAEDEDRIKNGPKNAVALGIEAKDYKKDEDPTGEKFFALRQQVYQRVPPGLRNSVLDTLDSKYNSKPLPLPEGTKGYLKHTLDTTFDPSGGVVPWRTAVPKLDAKGKTVIDKATGKAKLEWHDDLKAKQRAIDAQANVERQVTDYVREHPEASIQEINKHVNELLKPGTRAGALDAARAKQIRHGIQGASDLPEPGLIIPADDILFPQ